MFLFVKFVAFDADSFINNEYNKRAELFEEKVVKGSIITSDGYILAETQVDEEGNETRVYPYGEMFAHVTGYAKNVDNISQLSSHDFTADGY